MLYAEEPSNFIVITAKVFTVILRSADALGEAATRSCYLRQARRIYLSVYVAGHVPVRFLAKSEALLECLQMIFPGNLNGAAPIVVDSSIFAIGVDRTRISCGCWWSPRTACDFL